MEPIERVEHGLDLREHLTLNRAVWRMQPWFVAVLALMAFGSLSGLFGDGWLSRTTTGDAASEVVYQRFVRFGNEFVTEVRLNDLPAEVGIPLAYLGDFKLDRIVPEPERVRVEGATARFRFDADGHTVVRFHFLPDTTGRTVAVWTIGGTQVALSQWTWP